MSRRPLVLVAALVLPAALTFAAASSTAAPSGPPVSGAIFTTDSSGVPVNLNIYQNKEDVYLNGGPGINAPADAAGLPDGTYSFQVTNPSGRDLLSTDDVGCRQFTVVGGVIQDVVPFGNPSCQHATGSDGEDGGATVQLFPYLDTTNNGGVYKVWVTPTNKLNCARVKTHCFVPRYSKTDNFKVRNNVIVEIDTRFWRSDSSTPLLGKKVTWIDTVGASNNKYSEYNPAVLAYWEAHVEAAEEGTHQIQIANQKGCTIDHVDAPDGSVLLPKNGAVTVDVTVASHTSGDHTYWVDVQCKPLA